MNPAIGQILDKQTICRLNSMLKLTNPPNKGREAIILQVKICK